VLRDPAISWSARATFGLELLAGDRESHVARALLGLGVERRDLRVERLAPVRQVAQAPLVVARRSSVAASSCASCAMRAVPVSTRSPER
jgi:hypothetical protein